MVSNPSLSGKTYEDPCGDERAEPRGDFVSFSEPLEDEPTLPALEGRDAIKDWRLPAQLCNANISGQKTTEAL